MTTAELQRIAADIIPPAGASVAIAMVDHEPGGTLSNGYPSGIGGRTTFRAGFLVHGRQRVAVGPAFEEGRVALRLVRILNGEASAPRPAPVIPAVSQVGNGSDEPDQGRTGAPCAGCGEPLPHDARPNRRHHNEACRQRALYHRQAGADADADGVSPNLTVSRPSEAAPTSHPPTRSAHQPVPAELTRSAHPAAAPEDEGQRGDDLSLGLLLHSG